MTSLYDTLEVPSTASEADIRKAFRKKSRKAHPDSGGSKEELQKLSAAYHVLIDPARRKQYDRTGSTEELPGVLGIVANMMIQLVAETISVGQDPEQVDLLEMVRTRIGEGIAELTAKARNLEKQAAKFKKVVKRLQCKDNENLLAQSLLAHIAMMENGANAIPVEQAKLEECLRFLEDYQYKADEMKFAVKGWGDAYLRMIMTS